MVFSKLNPDLLGTNELRKILGISYTSLKAQVIIRNGTDYTFNRQVYAFCEGKF